MNPKDQERLDTITAAIHSLLNGQFPELIECSNEYDDEINQFHEYINRLIVEQKMLFEEILRISNGDITSAISSRLPVANSLKHLQASLRHLKWQAMQVAKGDFKQRTDFLGEFSDAFNWMVSELESHQSALTSEIEQRKKAEKELRKTHEQLEMLVEERTKELNVSNLSLKKEIKDKITIQEALRQSEEMFKAIALSALDAIIVINDKGKIICWNNAAGSIFQYNEDEAIGQDLHLLLAPPEYHERFLKGFAAFVVSGTGNAIGKRIELKAIRKDKTELPVELSLSSVKMKDKWHAIGTVRDISERKEKEQLKKQLLQVQKMESIGTLAGGIAHDFNNMLSVITGNVSYALSQIQKEEELFEILTDVQKGAKQAQTLTQQLLTFAKGGAPIKKAVNTNQLIEESARFIIRGVSARCEFKLPEDIWEIEVDQGQINQVISNLIINSIQAMPEGGIIQIEIENTLIDSKSGMPMVAGQYVKIMIKDHGIGISKKHLSKIFDPYFSTKQKGSGLGLSTSYSIIQKHGGHISVDSKIDKGTTFIIYLPASGKEIKNFQEKVDTTYQGQGKILIMDDEESILVMVTRMLSRVGYEIYTVNDGSQVIDMYQQAYHSSDPFDVVILDLTVPGGMGGAKVILELLKIDPNIKAIVSSGYSRHHPQYP